MAFIPCNDAYLKLHLNWKQKVQCDKIHNDDICGHLTWSFNKTPPPPHPIMAMSVLQGDNSYKMDQNPVTSQPYV